MAQGVRPSQSSKAAMAVMHASGVPNVKIAQQLDISPQTVSRFLNSDEMTAIRNKAESDFHKLLPRTVKVYKHRLEKDDLRAASEIAHGLGVLKPRAESNQSTTINVNILNQIQAASDEAIKELESWQVIDAEEL